jgi:dTDP-glucose 4,6-dehydratase
MNLFGERQHKEKFVALAIDLINKNQPVKIHAKLDSLGNVEYVGQRHWLHARNASNATLFLLNHGKPGEHYNVVGDTELYNDDLVKKIASIMNKNVRLDYVDLEKSRPGHDRRYSLDGSRLRDMGWKCPIGFDESLNRTIHWMLTDGNK